MYKKFRNFLRLVAKKQDVLLSSEPFIIQKYGWSLSNHQYWARDTEILNDNAFELIYDDNNGHAYQAIIYSDGSIRINGEGINKRMDKMLFKNKTAFGHVREA